MSSMSSSSAPAEALLLAASLMYAFMLCSVVCHDAGMRCRVPSVGNSRLVYLATSISSLA